MNALAVLSVVLLLAAMLAVGKGIRHIHRGEEPEAIATMLGAFVAVILSAGCVTLALP